MYKKKEAENNRRKYKWLILCYIDEVISKPKIKDKKSQRKILINEHSALESILKIFKACIFICNMYNMLDYKVLKIN